MKRPQFKGFYVVKVDTYRHGFCLYLLLVLD